MIRVAFFIAIACLCACKPGDPKPTKPVLTEEQLINLMVDIRLLEGAYSYHYRAIDTSEVKLKDYYQQIFEKHGTSAQQFQDSYNFYASQDGKLPELESAIMEKLEYMQVALETAQE
ncbi:MAG TPA: DUF4296 domain-containing protein [Flavobacteriales bacterium]